ncbi:MAG TPA: helicase-related protein [Candidatus Nitrosotenuis sp.]|nr:helicase-related protein [Candidatus Nitrosotenuis sp.]
MDKDITVLVRFDDHGYHEVEAASLQSLSQPLAERDRLTCARPLATIVRLQAEAILSVNDAWGVFSPSAIDLLPHQLWVCRKVNATWPTRWLVADDVGLGKTIEAGLILWPLISRGLVNRLLILTPASLVDQWRERLFDHFDLRLQVYRADEDRPDSRFWEREDRVVASFHTLRQDRDGRHERLLEADPWDMVMVDEAHHLNHDEELGPTLGYRLLQRMNAEGKIRSAVFFTGTPHRGKDWNFLALLQLLRGDLFSPRRATAPQLRHLPEVMIRNNKQTVTDLKGNRLFHPPKVRQVSYTYSPEEQAFYDLVSEFIRRGYAYSSRLSESMSAAVNLVLVAIQKLAASSVAAVLRALENRLARYKERRRERSDLERRLARAREVEDSEEGDRIAELEEELFNLSSELILMEDEEPFLRELVRAGQAIRRETKIELILDLLESDYAGRQVLLFTEYKATQSLLLSRMNHRFGDGCSVFINGDERAVGVTDAQGRSRTLTMMRSAAAEAFNSGRARYLVSTEAGGEGIDLQERCHTLIHVDLPWNPMRLHQRVGRLNRYGQTRQVEVVLTLNPTTVEARIWEKLMTKIDLINRAFESAMEEPEDLFPVVLGFTRPSFFNQLYSEGLRCSELRDEQSLQAWFDAKTAKFAGKDVLDTVRELVGNCARFNYQQISSSIPRLQLSDLKPFLSAVLQLNHRRLQEDPDGRVSFLTPDAWRGQPAIQPRYEGLHFDRKARGMKERKKILGVGNRLIQLALEQARAQVGFVAVVPYDALESPLFVFRIHNRLTEDGVRFAIAGVQVLPSGNPRLFKDWELLLELNRLAAKQPIRDEPATCNLEATDLLEEMRAQAESYLCQHLDSLNLPFRYPRPQATGVLWPWGSEQRPRRQNGTATGFAG